MQAKGHRGATGTKRRILRAAAHIVNTAGVLALTLEAVAKEAGISKGGLLYHYAGKEALLTGMHDYVMQGFIGGVESAAAADPCEKGRWTRAYATTTFAQLAGEFDLNVAVLAAVATNPALLKSAAGHLKELQARIGNDRLDPAVSAVVRLAADGMYFNELYGMSLEEDSREKVLNGLISLTRRDSL